MLASPLAGTHTYHTYLRPRFESFGYAARMTITISSDGYVNGTYRPQNGGGIDTVRGGRQGNKIWFDIGTLGGVHVEGTVDDSGAISGLASPLGPRNKTYVFTADPESSP
jgi:hypothetical protein